ncbi:polysaccharide export outer membrane protein [Desulfacinum infernum DSM 9756]|uniref:Polysaccharide export outer membrane protein n=1 Tax=Desulfacinum infernum DSM 9756 TaxID=1121391 RepID=A0A1M5GI36_9BACT|nr:polysaccharide biosynthesis/export family protein [Desulfacinum infernum]SHG03172.1 polysaccharide export outer membrane protein [Desulfacinum infernum DSM 9756]
MKRRTPWITALAVWMIFFSTALVQAQEAKEVVPGPEEARPPEVGDYVIGKGDALEIYVWREPELTRQTQVRLDGMISLPLLDDIRAAGRTPMDLKNEIQKRLSEFLEQPVVSVIVTASANNKYYMVGEVNAPGEQDLIKDLTILQALARAGGLTEWANKKRIVILRRENGVEKRMVVNYNDILHGKSPEQNIYIHPNDTIVVP